MPLICLQQHSLLLILISSSITSLVMLLSGVLLSIPYLFCSTFKILHHCLCHYQVCCYLYHLPPYICSTFCSTFWSSELEPSLPTWSTFWWSSGNICLIIRTRTIVTTLIHQCWQITIYPVICPLIIYLYVTIKLIVFF